MVPQAARLAWVQWKANETRHCHPGHEREREVAEGKQHASDRNQMHQTGHPMTWRMCAVDRETWPMSHCREKEEEKRRRGRGRSRRLLPNPSCCLEIDLPTSATRAAPNTAAVCFAPRPSLMRNPPGESTFRLFDHRRSRSPPPARYLRHRPLSFPTFSRAFPSSPLDRPCRCWCGVLRSIFRRFNVHSGRASTGSHQNCGHTSRRPRHGRQWCRPRTLCCPPRRQNRRTRAKNGCACVPGRNPHP